MGPKKGGLRGDQIGSSSMPGGFGKRGFDLISKTPSSDLLGFIMGLEVRKNPHPRPIRAKNGSKRTLFGAFLRGFDELWARGGLQTPQVTSFGPGLRGWDQIPKSRVEKLSILGVFCGFWQKWVIFVVFLKFFRKFLKNFKDFRKIFRKIFRK